MKKQLKKLNMNTICIVKKNLQILKVTLTCLWKI